MIITKVIRYCWIITTGLACWIFLHGFNKTYILGRKNVPREGNMVIIANHQSWIDSWPISFAVFWPWALLKPHVFPWHMPEHTNFYKNPILRLVCRLSQCIPVTRGKTRFHDLEPHIEKLREGGTVEVFPEGTRHRGETQDERDTLYNWRLGAAHMACCAKATVLPVAIRGMADLWPVKQRWPKLFGNVIVIIIGKSVDLRSYWDRLGKNGFRHGNDEHQEVRAEVSNAIKEKLQETLSLASRIFHNELGDQKAAF